MNMRSISRAGLASAAMLCLLGSAQPAHAVDEDAAQALAKKDKCTKCHSVDKKKEGPSFKETAAKYKDKADAEAKLYTHLTTSPKVKVDGKEEEHTNIKSASDAEIKNLIAYILSR
jgi:cytochrome c